MVTIRSLSPPPILESILSSDDGEKPRIVIINRTVGSQLGRDSCSYARVYEATCRSIDGNQCEWWCTVRRLIQINYLEEKVSRLGRVDGISFCHIHSNYSTLLQDRDYL